ncbi:MAG: HigA family addiction module antidote protein [Thermoanaerobaculia bacterium]|nr:HigA family addiction module antidote protein [Thermoanaerobaculia bacterium]
MVGAPFATSAPGPSSRRSPGFGSGRACCVLRNALQCGRDSIDPAPRASPVLRIGEQGRDPTGARAEASDAAGGARHREVDRGHGGPRLPVARAAGGPGWPLGDLGERELAPHFRISGRGRLRRRLRGLPLMAMHNPPHPGEFLAAVYLEPNGLSGRELAAKLGVAASTLSRILKGTSAVSPEMALRLEKALGRSAESWLALQSNHDLWHAKKRARLGRVSKVNLTAA